MQIRVSINAHSFYYGGKFLSKIIDLIRSEIEPIIDQRGDEFVDIEYVKEKGQNYLRIYVDKDQPGGIDINEIADLSELVSEKLDSLDPDPLPDPYVLELSSPGAERPIKSAKDWARIRDYSKNSDDPTAYAEPEVYTFENKGFTAKILDSAGGSSMPKASGAIGSPLNASTEVTFSSCV